MQLKERKKHNMGTIKEKENQNVKYGWDIR